jgi:murein DD-endopeptidase MepM/ murein hydrolase activator NlpD
VAIAMTSMNALFSIFQLSVYSLPFNFVVLLFIYILKFRERFYFKPELVVVQQFSPEKNLYSNLNYIQRFKPGFLIRISLPFWGNWKVTQGHNGDITHKEDWKHAWDFEVFDEEGSNHDHTGNNREDYYCYDKPLLAPGEGYVEEIVDGIKDNDIGEINMKNNWGNTIIIKHGEKFYSKISHIKPGSFKVKKGDSVKRGDIVASCGNSGRSPVPHLHFQLQKDPFIGASTIDYPVGHYILYLKNRIKLLSFNIPEYEDLVSNIKENQSLSKAFNFVPGQGLAFDVEDSIQEKSTSIRWTIKADLYKNTYLFCPGTGSKAYFKNESDTFYFTHFEGNKKSYLYYFYLGAFKIIKGYYKNLNYTDQYPLNSIQKNVLGYVQDIIAPFYRFIQSEFNLTFSNMKENLIDSVIDLSSETIIKTGKKKTREISYNILIENNRIQNFRIMDGERRILLSCKNG